MSRSAWRYRASVLWFGILVMERWGLPAASHGCAMELMVMEAVGYD